MNGEVSLPPHLLTLEFLKPAQQRAFFERVGRFDKELNRNHLEATVVPGNAGLKATLRSVFQRLGGSCVLFQKQPVENEKQLEKLAESASNSDVICAAFRDHRFAERLAEKFVAPVVNLGSDWAMPAQVLADCYTISQRADRFNLCFIGRPGAYCHSLMRAAALLDFELSICLPTGTAPDGILLESLRDRGAALTVKTAPTPVAGADFVGVGPDYEKVVSTNDLSEVLVESDVKIFGSRKILRAPDVDPPNNLFETQRNNFELLLTMFLLVFNQSEKIS